MFKFNIIFGNLQVFMKAYLFGSVLLLSSACTSKIDKHSLNSPTQPIAQKENITISSDSNHYDFDDDLNEIDEKKMDPLEPINRVTFGFNRFVDVVFMRPVTLAYKKIIPNPVQNGVSNFLKNIYEPVNMINHLLQGNLKEMSFSGLNFVFNTTFGIGGVFSVADKMLMINPKQTSFDETFAKWGIKPGFYVMLPIFGPSSLRGTAATVANWYLDPVSRVLRKKRKAYFYQTKMATAVDTHKNVISMYDQLNENSLDFYAGVRSAYLQKINKK